MCPGCSRHRAESYYLKQLDTRRISKEITNSHVRLWKHLTQRSPKRSLVVSFYKIHSLFLFLVLNWKLSSSAANNCNKTLNTPSCWHAPSSGTCTYECCWVSVDCLLLIHYVWLMLTLPNGDSLVELGPCELRVQASGKERKQLRGMAVSQPTHHRTLLRSLWLFPYWSGTCVQPCGQKN